jgi:hypothetical protein
MRTLQNIVTSVKRLWRRGTRPTSPASEPIPPAGDAPPRTNMPPRLAINISPDGQRLVIRMSDQNYFMQIELPPEHTAYFVDMGLAVVMNDPNVVMQFDELLEYKPRPEERCH